MTQRVALATASSLPTPDDDELLLLPLMPGTELAAWDDPTVDWAAFDAVILRSTWNYTEKLPEFLEWIAHVDTLTRLVNPAPVVRWNTDKRYLGELASRGFPVVPTTYVAPGDDVAADALAGRIVVKPTVGAGSKGAGLFNDARAARTHLDGLLDAGLTAMIQPYLSQVDSVGETALVFLGGRFSHAARKAALLSQELSWSTGLYADEKITKAVATAEQLELAHSIVSALPSIVEGGDRVAYARVDVLPTEAGPVVLELELTEPSLFLAMDPGAPERAARALTAAAGA